MENNEAFLGQGWSFPPEFFSNGSQVELVAGEEDILQSLQILLSTALGERTMFSSYGSDLSQFMFEEIDQALINGLRNVVENSLLNNEPRVKVLQVDLDAQHAHTGTILISIDYLVRTTNNRYNLVYPFYLLEASNH